MASLQTSLQSLKQNARIIGSIRDPNNSSFISDFSTVLHDYPKSDKAL